METIALGSRREEFLHGHFQYFGTQVPESASVCTGCGAEIVHGLNRRERSFVGLSFVMVALLIGVVIWRALEIAHGAPVLNRPSRSSVLRWKELRSPLVAFTSAILPLVSTSIKSRSKAGASLIALRRNMAHRWKRELHRRLRPRTSRRRSDWPIQSRNLPTYSASIISASIVSSSAESYAPVAHFAGSCSFRARNCCDF